MVVYCIERLHKRDVLVVFPNKSKFSPGILNLISCDRI